MSSDEAQESLMWLGILFVILILFKMGGDVAFWYGYSKGYAQTPDPPALQRQPTCEASRE